ncbi:nitroreductase family protein [Methanobrevibacter sp. DSM 116169]|uniref:nitroreductase family protein n=1 Tax=Methanobrevibacter sp. DSM 116169 TaxID=3242727 RepID=UPI0038FBF9B5
MKDIFDVINNRRSTRSYKEEQIKDDEIEKILDAGFMAPTARAAKPWHFTVIQNKDLLKYINESSLKIMSESGDEFLESIAKSGQNILHNAPTVIVVSAQKDAPNMQADSSAAIENMLLAAEGLDIGSCWLGLIQAFFKDEENIKKLEIPEDYIPLYGVSLGYKTKENPQITREKNNFNWIK